MSSTTISLISTGCIFGGALLGLRLQALLPNHHLGKDSHEIMKLGFGIIGTLTALVLGLLISSAKTSFDAMNSSIMQGSSKIILLDRVLAQYGPETKPLRDHLRRSVAAGIEKVWGPRDSGVSSSTAIEDVSALESLQGQLRQLAPQTDVQRQLLAQAQQLASDFAQARWLFVEQAQNQLPLAFLAVLVFWLALLFTSFGLFAPRNNTVMVALLLCACSVSAAIFLVLEMNRPLNGLIKVSDAPLRKAVELLGK